MKRHWVFALATLVALPRLAHAQSDTGWGPRLRVTPFVGVSPGIHQNGIATVFSGATVTQRRYRQDLSSALPLGINAEYRFWNRFSVLAEGAYASRGNGTLLDFDEEQVWDTDGSNFFLGKADLGVRLRENNPDLQLHRGLSALLYVGPAFIHDQAKVSLTTPAAATGDVNQWGLNVGADAEMPMANNRLAFQLGLENFIIFWDHVAYRQRIEPYFQQTDPNAVVAIDPKNTNFWILRAGLTFRF